MMQDLGAKMMKIVEEYATQNGFATVLDVSNPQTDVLWAAASTNITPDIIRLYDQAHAVAETPKAPAAAPRARQPRSRKTETERPRRNGARGHEVSCHTGKLGHAAPAMPGKHALACPFVCSGGTARLRSVTCGVIP